MIVTIIIFLIILAALVFVHELGHFVLAKLVGARVDEFALGFPPRIFSFKKGETVYALNAIPFGGYVKILGEDADESTDTVETIDRERSLAHKSRWAQAAVMISGISMNVIFAWILLSIAFMIGIPASSDNYFNAPVSNPHISIISVNAGSPAEKAGLALGDAIVGISAVTPSGTTTIATAALTITAIQNLINTSTGPIMLSYVADKELKNGAYAVSDVHVVSVEPTSGIVTDRKAIGIAMDTVGLARLSFFNAIYQGAKGTIYMVVNTFKGLGVFFAGLVGIHTGLEAHISDVSGPVGIAKMVGEARSFGFAYLLSFTALISINLAIINALPLPALDGGRIAVIAIEGIIRRSLNPRAVNLTHVIGFIVLITLMLAITAHDIIKLF